MPEFFSERKRKKTNLHNTGIPGENRSDDGGDKVVKGVIPGNNAPYDAKRIVFHESIFSTS